MTFVDDYRRHLADVRRERRAVRRYRFLIRAAAGATFLYVLALAWCAP